MSDRVSCSRTLSEVQQDMDEVDDRVRYDHLTRDQRVWCDQQMRKLEEELRHILIDQGEEIPQPPYEDLR